MGINVSAGREVSYDDTHQDMVNTCVKSNPTKSTIHGLAVHNIFERRKAHRQDDSRDGNSLIYALKAQRRYTISREELCRFMPGFYKILGCIAAQVQPNSIIIPMPSSHKISLLVATRLQRMVHGAEVREGMFSKVTCEAAYQQLQAASVPHSARHDRNQLLAELRSSGAAPFNMKQVGRKLRGCINPLQIVSLPEISGRHVWLVDDLISSGQTLTCAAKLLREASHPSSISAVGLLGSHHFTSRPYDAP